MTEHIKDLIPDPHNARLHTPRNVGMVERSLGEVGAARSIVIDESNTILAGNATVEAAAAAGITKVQIVDADGETLIAVRRSGLTEDQKRKLALYDNRTAELADWDPAQIAADLAVEVDLSGLWSDKELEIVLGNFELPDPDPQREPELKAEHFIEIYCDGAALDHFMPTLNEWSNRPGVTVNVS